jgi:hypothetical protein
MVITCAVALVACGGGSTTGPDKNSGCSVPVGVLGCPKGLIRATVDGQSVNCGVANGGALYTPVAAIPSLNLAAQDFINIVGIASTNAQISLVTRAKVRSSAVGQNVLDPDLNNVSVNSIMYIVPAGAAVASGWACNVSGGSGTITVTAVSPSAASGSFSCTMTPVANTPSTGNRQVSGTIEVTF